jgi:hypothetical protein
MLANKPEQPLTITLDVVAIKEPLPMIPRYKGTEPQFAVGQQQVPQILAVSPEHVEGIEPGFLSPEQQVPELRLAVAVEGNDFAVEHSRPGTEFGKKALD